MTSESRNPWESLRIDYTTEASGDSQDHFNTIKLNDFPFLRSHLCFVDYLVQCKACGVILLPETACSHYEDRHNGSTGYDDKGIFLPYQAGYHLNDSVNHALKRERVVKRSKLPNKRRRSSHRQNPESMALGTISETDSLSSLNDEAGKQVSSNVSEDEAERLREPVLMKLAKSDYHSVFDTNKHLRLSNNPKQSPSERSVWSFVCPQVAERQSASRGQQDIDDSGLLRSKSDIPSPSVSADQPNERLEKTIPEGYVNAYTTATACVPLQEDRSVDSRSVLQPTTSKRSRLKRPGSRRMKRSNSAMADMNSKFANDPSFDIFTYPDDMDAHPTPGDSHEDLPSLQEQKLKPFLPLQRNGFHPRFTYFRNSSVFHHNPLNTTHLESIPNETQLSESPSATQSRRRLLQFAATHNPAQRSSRADDTVGAYMWSEEWPTTNLPSVPDFTNQYVTNDFADSPFGLHRSELRFPDSVYEARSPGIDFPEQKQKDLRILMREARDRFQDSRRLQVSHTRQTSALDPNCTSTLDLTENTQQSIPTDLVKTQSAHAVDEPRLEVRLLGRSSRSLPKQRMMCRDSPMEFPSSNPRFHTGRLTGMHDLPTSSGGINPRFIRQPSNRSGSLTLHSADAITGSPSSLDGPDQSSTPSTFHLTHSSPFGVGATPLAEEDSLFGLIPSDPISVGTSRKVQSRRSQFSQQRSAVSVPRWSMQLYTPDAGTPTIPSGYYVPGTSRQAHLSDTQSVVGEPVYLGHAPSTVVYDQSPDPVSNRLAVSPMVSYPRHPFATSRLTRPQVIREHQSRVIVDELREKSITGRSRKAARHGARHPAPIYGGSAFTGLFPSRLHNPAVQSQQSNTCVPAHRKSYPMGFLSTRATYPVFAANDSMVITRPSSVFDASSRHPSGSGGGPRRVETMSAPQPNPSHEFISSDELEHVNVDCYPQVTDSVIRTDPSPNGMLDTTDRSGTRPSDASSSVPTSIGQSAPDPGGQVCRNRYFVIKPSAIPKQPAGMVVRAKRPDACPTDRDSPPPGLSSR